MSTGKTSTKASKAVREAPVSRNRPSRALPKRILVVPDTHRPFHSEVAWNAMLKAARGWKPNIIICLGDFADFYSVSSHSKDPNRVSQLDVELEDVNRGLDELDALGATSKFFIQGNHEQRMERYLADRAPALFNSIKVERLFRLRERGWSYTPYRSGLRLGKAYFTHDLGQAGAFAHQRARTRYGGNIVIGHTHFAGLEYQGNVRGDVHVGIASGWLGDSSKIDYTTQVNANEWVNAFTIAYMEPNGFMHFQLIPILRGRCMVEGKIYG